MEGEEMRSSELARNLLNSLKNVLLSKIDDIDTGNSNLTEDGIVEILTTILNVSDMSHKISKYEACLKLHLSRATFDNYVRMGKLPRGQKQVGFKELFWTLRDIENFKEKYWKEGSK